MNDSKKNEAPQTQFSLNEIYENVKNETIDLPTVQRGFVWKISQIENLWDSILRGFPIGSLTFSFSDGKYLILDGQQRTTAISLGFRDYRNTEKILNCDNEKRDNVLLFLSIEKAKSDLRVKRKFIFRAITRSHPWGYSKSDNTLKLEIGQRNWAKGHLYGENEYEDFMKSSDHKTRSDLSKFIPKDAEFPVPFSIFTCSENIEQFRKNLTNYIESFKGSNEKIYSYLEEKYRGESNKEIPNQKNKYLTNIELSEELYREVQRAILNAKLPLLELDIDSKEEDESISEELKMNSQQTEGEMSADEEDSDELDDIEEVFLRLNSGGTLLKGEELVYSLLKNSVRKIKNKEYESFISKLEDFCGKLIRPSRALAIGFKFFQFAEGKNSVSNVKVKPKEFQNFIKSKKNGVNHQDELIKFLNNKFMSSLEQFRELIKYSSFNKSGVDPFNYSNMFNTSPEITLFALIRINHFGDYEKINADKTLKDRFIGSMLYMNWFGRGVEKSKNHEPLFKNIYPLLNPSYTTQDIWTIYVISRIQYDTEKYKALMISELESTLNEFKGNRKIEKNDLEKKMINASCFNKGVVSYNQRDFLFSEIQEYDWTLDDTNIPIDWDHIIPKKIFEVRNVSNLNEVKKFWKETNGNFRAWPFSMNRSDQDNIPFVKFSKSPSDTLEYLNTTTNNNNKCKIEMCEEKIKNSFCSAQWYDETICSENIRNTKTINIIKGLIIDRNIQLISSLQGLLKINTKVEIPNVTKAYKEISKYFSPHKTVMINTDPKEDDLMLVIDLVNSKIKLCIYFYSGNPFELNQAEVSFWTDASKDILGFKEFEKYDVIPFVADPVPSYYVGENFTLLGLREIDIENLIFNDFYNFINTKHKKLLPLFVGMVLPLKRKYPKAA